MYVQQDMKAPASLHENTLFLLGECSKAVRDQVLQKIKESGYDVSPEQFTILVTLFYNDGMKQSDIIKTVNRDKTTVSRVLGRMIKNGLVSSRQLDKTSRENSIFITEKGKKIQQDLINATGSIYMQTLDSFSEKEIDFMNNLLLRMYKNTMRD